MKIFLLLIVAVTSAHSLVPIENGWRHVKSPLDTPHFHDIMSKINENLPNPTPNTRRGRIAGGELASLGQFPHLVLLYNYDRFGDTYICGSSIISHNWLLTAGHCLYEIVRTTVYAGMIDRIRGPAVYSMDVTSASGNFIFHEDYSGITNDIALIRLVSSIPNHQHVGIVALPRRSDVSVVLDGKMATVAGFGRVNDVQMQPSEFLRFVTQTIYPNSKCEASFGKANVKDTNLCLSGAGGKGTCQGELMGDFWVRNF
jgi:secreted trypsin-like serine protease